MKMYCLKLFVAMYSFLMSGSVYTCSGNPVPIHLLGKNAYNKEVDFQEFLAVVDVAPSPDSDLLNVAGTWERWFIVDKNRNYFSLSAADGLVKGLFIDDRCLITEAGVRVGDALPRVIVAYPDAKFKQGGKLLETDFFEMSANDGKVEFWFAAKKVRDLIRDGYQVHLNDEVVKESTVSAIIVNE